MSLLLPTMLNLAPVRYANCFQSEGGPVEAIQEYKLQIDGRLYTAAVSRLHPGYSQNKRQHQVFSDFDGTGLSENPAAARYIAISEAMERWAHATVAGTRTGDEYGFHYDPTSNGMAAFPGLFAKQARQFAMAEAIERYGLIAWWDGKIGAHELDSNGDGIRYYRLHQPFKNWEVIVSRRKDKGGFTAFGYGSGKDLKEAKRKSRLEMHRSGVMLGQFFRKNPGFEPGDLSTLDAFAERRLVYFALPEGVLEFEHKIANPPTFSDSTIPDILFDGEIPGPWSSYASVWRIVFRQTTMDFLNPGERFFYW